MSDVTAESRSAMLRITGIEPQGCANNQPPEVIAALIGLALAAIGAVCVAAWRKVRR